MKLAIHLGVLPLAAICCARAEIIDRIAVVVDKDVITDSQVRREIRITSFLNGEELNWSGQAKRQAAERLVDQTLIRNEMEASSYSMPEPEAVEEMIKELLATRFNGDATRYREALKKYNLTEEELKTHLRWQIMTLRFISLRFRAGIRVPEEEINEYFAKQVLPRLPKIENGGPIELADDHRSKIEQVLIEEHADKQSEAWLKEARTRIPIRFHSEVFE